MFSTRRIEETVLLLILSFVNFPAVCNNFDIAFPCYKFFLEIVMFLSTGRASACKNCAPTISFHGELVWNLTTPRVILRESKKHPWESKSNWLTQFHVENTLKMSVKAVCMCVCLCFSHQRCFVMEVMGRHCGWAKFSASIVSSHVYCMSHVYAMVMLSLI